MIFRCISWNNLSDLVFRSLPKVAVLTMPLSGGAEGDVAKWWRIDMSSHFKWYNSITSTSKKRDFHGQPNNTITPATDCHQQKMTDPSLATTTPYKSSPCRAFQSLRSVLPVLPRVRVKFRGQLVCALCCLTLDIESMLLAGNCLALAFDKLFFFVTRLQVK